MPYSIRHDPALNIIRVKVTTSMTAPLARTICIEAMDHARKMVPGPSRRHGAPIFTPWRDYIVKTSMRGKTTTSRKKATRKATALPFPKFTV